MQERIKNVVFNRFFIAGVSGFLFFIVKSLKNSRILSLTYFSDIKPISVTELMKNPKKHENTYLLVQGRFDPIDGEWQHLKTNFKLEDEFSSDLWKYRLKCSLIGDSKIFNPRRGFIDNLSIVSKLLFGWLLKILEPTVRLPFDSGNDTRWFDPYLVKGDQVTVYGRFSEKELDIDMICQGNKTMLVEEVKRNARNLERLQHVFGGISMFIIIREIMKQVSSFIRYVTISNLLSVPRNRINDKAKCAKCNHFLKNVVLLDCNHFAFCINCINLVDSKCPLCGTGISNYYVLKAN